MKQTEIISNIKTRLGIESLNDMQLVMSGIETRGTAVLLAPTGSGKTVAFAIPMLRSLPAPQNKVMALVIAPSRELVLQIAEVIRQIATGYKTTALYGGHPMQEEINSLSVTPDIIVATPGRLLDHLKRGQLDLSAVGTLVLDEYDKSLELGFADEMRRIVK
ncbi:MAG: DEAD/DEAH box helicase, partial [Duncaniella sp.]|nr:DEAD/DEAH box helicase [Duncaniella sp.]